MNRNEQAELLVWQPLRNADCTACVLHKEAKTVCNLGDGPVPALAAVLGEAPGFSEDEKRIPFCGKSGIFLRRMLKETDLDPRQIFFFNAVACRPPGNRAPKKKEINACESFRNSQLEIVKPKAVLLLGNSALTAITGKRGKITQAEGNVFWHNGVAYVPCRHPSAVVRVENDPSYPFHVQAFKENLIIFRNILYPKKDDFEFSRQESFAAIKPGPVYTDIESNGLDFAREGNHLHCIGYCQDPKEITSFPVENIQRESIQKFLTDHPIMAHRATFEGTWYRWHYGITPKIWFDTKLMAYLRDENDNTGLKYQAVRRLGVDPWSEEQDFENPNWDIMLPYNARDSCYGMRLFTEQDRQYLKRHPKLAKLLKYILLPSMEVFVEIITNGFHIHEEESRKKLKTCQTEKKKLNLQLNKIAGKEVNPGSPKQMSRLFYEQLGLECPVKTAKGKNSTAEASLVRLSGQHEAVDVLSKWRGWDKYESTYLEPWLRKGPVLHANYDYTGTDTGRLSSSMVKNKRSEKKLGAVIHQCPRDPFIRNIITPRGYPVIDKDGKFIGRMTDHPKARPEDWCIVAADWSQIELRLVAHCARELTMIGIFNAGEDIHLATAMHVLKRRADEIDKETRKKAKAVNFGFVYGMWWKKFKAYAKEKFALDVTDREAKDYRRGFFRKYNGLESWYSRVKSVVSKTGEIESIFGRVRHLPQAKEVISEACPDCGAVPEENCFLCGGLGFINADNNYEDWARKEAIRQAINSPIQGAGNDLDLLMAALIASYSLPWEFKIDRRKVIPIGAAHDSLLFECHKTYAKTLKEGIEWTVENLPLKKFFDVEMLVPLKMDCSIYESCWEGELLVID